MRFTFSGEIWYWRGPSPFYFVTVPAGPCREIHAVAGQVSYGWGMIPATVTIGASTFSTALWPKDGAYVVPLKTVVRRAEDLDEGLTVTVQLTVDDGD